MRRRSEDAGIRALPWNDPAFPPLLAAISDCPPLLWYSGDLAALNAPMVAIVGSRAATSVAIDTAARLATDLAQVRITSIRTSTKGSPPRSLERASWSANIHRGRRPSLITSHSGIE